MKERDKVIKLLDGKKVADKILKPVKKEILYLKQKGVVPTLAIFLVGEDRESLIYVKEKQKKAKEIGIKIRAFKLKANSKTEEVKTLIEQQNQDVKTHGILVQLPLPPRLNSDKILNLIKPDKEVDGITPKTLYPPACAAGILEIFTFYEIPIKNKKVIILGKGKIVGRPLFPLLKKAGGEVSLCSTKTKNIFDLIKTADILVCGLSTKDFVSKDMIKKNAVVIDAAKNVKEEVKEVASYLTPKIGGVGPVTVAMLLKNVVKAAKGT